MNRRLFLTQALVAATLGAGIRPEWAFPGRLAIFAQRLRDEHPFVYDNANASFPAASIIKLVILVALVREIDAGRLRWSDRLPINGREIVAGSETFGRIAPGSTAGVEALAKAMIAQSDNTAGNVLADHLSFVRVNDVAESLGLAQTRLRRHFMDFVARGRGIDNTTSARDVGMLLLALGRGARGKATRVASASGCRAMVGIMLRQEDRETIPAGIERRVQIANKTGVLADVRNDVAIVDPYGGNSYVVALLSQFTPAVTARAYELLRKDATRVDNIERA